MRLFKLEAICCLIYLTNDIVTCQDGCLCLEEKARDLSAPLVMEQAKDGRYFVGSQTGVITIFNRNWRKRPQPFANITGRVKLLDGAKERGFVGMALHPNFVRNGRFFVTYTTIRRSDGKEVIRLSEMRVSGSNRNVADTRRNRERIMVEEIKPKPIHHGGQLLFDSRGFLYNFIGDGGVQGDPDDIAQNRSTLKGKIIRLNVSNANARPPYYTIPRSNPFVGHPGRREIYAVGVRNPYSGCIDRGDPKTGAGKDRIFFGDVGWFSREEVNMLTRPGRNFGWAWKEGAECNVRRDCSGINLAREVLPLRGYSRDEGGCVIVGAVYRGCRNPNLNGILFYADHGFSRVYSLTKRPGSNTWRHSLVEFCESCPRGLTSKHGRFILRFAEDLNGEVYILSRNDYSKTPALFSNVGYIHRLVDPRTHGRINEDCERVRRCTTNTNWRSTVTSGNMECENCTCNQLSRRASLFERACKQNIARVRRNCCGACRSAGHIN